MYPICSLFAICSFSILGTGLLKSIAPLSNEGVAQFETKRSKVSTFEQGAGFAWLYRRYPDHWNLVFNAASKADA
jgi:hypothetical protein